MQAVIEAARAMLHAEYKAASDKLNAVAGERGPTGLTSAAVKASAEYKAAKQACDRAFETLRAFNRKNKPTKRG